MNEYSISKEAKFVLARLEENNEESYLVGGCVRDYLLNKEPSDFDVTTSARPERIMEIFSDKRLVTLGKEFGTIGVLIDDSLIEVTTYRFDGNYLDGRHPERVSFSTSLIEDLKRRDFTINSMAMNIEKNIIDPFGGRVDLERNIIRSVGQPEKRFSEDKLRMLRAIRFANRLSFSIEENTLKAIEKMAKDINQVSKERIRDEINKILLSDSPDRGLDLLLEAGLLGEIFPELVATVGYDQKSPYHHRNLYKHISCVVARSPKKLHIRLAALFHDIAKVQTLTIDDKGVGHFYGHDQLGASMAEDILKRLKYDKKTIKKVRLLIEKHMKAIEIWEIRV